MKNNPLITHNDRIYYIDALRAAAILLVILAHTVAAYGPTNWIAPLQFGGSGVDLFFLLSGWLIGSQLYKEFRTYNNIDVKRFWIRRWLRTLPAYYAVLFATLAQQYITKESVASPIPHLLFFQNYTDMTYFTISWSLALEEQFYLLIAPIVFFFHKFNNKIQTSCLIILLLLPSVFRHLGWYESPEETHVRWDCCLMGVLLANVYHHHPKIWKKIVPFSLILLLVCVLLYLSVFWTRWLPLYGMFAQPSPLVLAIIFAGFLIYAVNRPIKKLRFGHTIIMHVSTRSYSMYLLHVEALAITKKLGFDSNFFLFTVITIVLTMLLSEILFKFVEQPLLRKRADYGFSSARTKVEGSVTL